LEVGFGWAAFPIYPGGAADAQAFGTRGCAIAIPF
jgi:hypothetical protein